MRRALASIAILTAATFLPPASASHAETGSCGRTCLSGVADAVLASMVAHDPAHLPLARTYAATENAVPAALGMMTLWRTATAAKSKYYIIDPESRQLFMIASIAEGPNDTLLFGRLKVEAGLLSEIELYTNHSRGQGGFQFDGDGPSHFPAAWTVALRPEQRMSRSQLLQAGRSIFDTGVTGPEASEQCVLMENGKVVAEDPEVFKAVGPPSDPGAPKPKPRAPNPDGTLSIPCGSPAERPTDPAARTDIVDEEQGVVVSIATVQGIAEPYLVTNPTLSAFVPNQLLRPYADMLKKQQASGVYTAPALRPMKAGGTVAQVHRIFDGKVQGMQLLVNLGAPGLTSPWVNQ